MTAHSALRRPVHTVYGGAHLFKRTTRARLGELARGALTTHAPTPAALSEAMGVPERLAETVRRRVEEKLAAEPVEDYRIDFEDGFGVRPDEEEDAAADAAAAETAEALAAGTLPPFFGIRIKSLEPQSEARATRTLDRYLHALTERTGGELPRAFCVTLPKITTPQQVRALLNKLAAYPRIQIELMIETPQGVLRIAELLDAAGDRCAAVHFGPYDYMSSLGIIAGHQTLRHPACEHARSVLQVALAERDVRFSDGPTATLPLPARRGEPGTEAVHRAWKLHYDNVRHALIRGIYQGWDLHPAQLPARYASIFAFFLDGLDDASARLRNFVAQSGQATRVGDAFDDAATVRGLAHVFLRAAHCGAIPASELPGLAGLTLDELAALS
jgi:citrate lyase beta subunit